MTMEKIGGVYPEKFQFEEIGDKLAGNYVETRVVESDKFESGEATFVTIKDKEGKEWSIIISGLLKWLFEQAKLAGGEYVEVTYQGKKEIQKGKKKFQANQWDLSVDRANKLK